MEEAHFKLTKVYMGSLKRTYITYKCLATRNNQIFLHRKLVRGKNIVEVIVNLCFTSTIL